MAANGIKKVHGPRKVPHIYGHIRVIEWMYISILKLFTLCSLQTTTSLVGYAVVPNARDVLCSLYAKTISVIQSFPKDSAYRRQTEQVVQQRLQIVQADSSPEGIERKIGCGQMEELIDQVS